MACSFRRRTRLSTPSPLPFSDQKKLQVTLNGKTLNASVKLASITQIRVFARDGDDSITLAGLNVPVYVEGGGGADSFSILGKRTANAFTLAAASVVINGK